MNTENLIKQTVRFITISAENADQRIDNFLRSALKGVPKSHLYRLLRKGEIRINKKRAKPEQKLQIGDEIRLPPIKMSKTEEFVPSLKLDKIAQIEQSILFEDDCLIAINKESGLAVHGGSGLSFGAIEALRLLRPQAKFLELVHRLDRSTSGILLIAKKRSALKHLHEQLRENQMHKEYLALVKGKWNKKQTKIEVPLQKNTLKSGERIVIVDPNGKYSKTYFELISHFEHYSLIKAIPITGRTHQIRVHCAHAKHSIAFDERYGNIEEDKLQIPNLNRLFLHANLLEFIHPKTEQKITLNAPLKLDLQKVLTNLNG